MRFPYYGDLLDGLVRQVDAPLLTGVIPRGALSKADLEFRAALLMEIARGAGISEQDILANYDGEPHERGLLNEPWIQAILRALDRTPAGDRSIDRFTRDVYAYLTFPGIRAQVDDTVRALLQDGPAVVVSHSLGSVVAYNVLANAPASLDVKLFVTVGSPLGIRTVRTRAARPLAVPSCASEWFNAFDPRDVVSLFPLDSTYFPTEKPIENYNRVNNHTDNRHGIDGYLDDVVVARHIHDALI